MKTLKLEDVMADSTLEGDAAPAITVGFDASDTTYDNGILIHTPTNAGVIVYEDEAWEYRIVVENKEGKLMLHVWATGDSIGNDPTHSIEIEIRREI